LEAGGAVVDLCPVADGGEGTMMVLVGALGGDVVDVVAPDPLGRPVDCRFALLGDGRTAVVEVAQASGLDRLSDHERDGVSATSYGTGALIVHAIDAGAETVLIAAGGSATTDGGHGAIRALERAGGPRGTALVVLCDVASRFEQAADLFGPQKGADAAAIGRLRSQLDVLADGWAKTARDPRGVVLTGAAGGLSGGFWAQYGARLVGGSAFVLEHVNFDARLRRARAVVIGEGRLDATTLEGKIAAEIARRARAAGVPCHAIVGSEDGDAAAGESLALASIATAGTEVALVAAGRRLAGDNPPQAVLSSHGGPL
jgi:glycerate kinase